MHIGGKPASAWLQAGDNVDDLDYSRDDRGLIRVDKKPAPKARLSAPVPSAQATADIVERDFGSMSILESSCTALIIAFQGRPSTHYRYNSRLVGVLSGGPAGVIYPAPHNDASLSTAFLNAGGWPTQGLLSFMVGLPASVFSLVGADSAIGVRRFRAKHRESSPRAPGTMSSRLPPECYDHLPGNEEFFQRVTS
ncbi:hypothetical protein GGS23DRAFT_613241 [Durotheca rogersii]|uniref:uncharacterized protein n=1 Tax=Durotheca rogersii TaxID=419775 RepID=UPI00221F0138|nr:uncharacterized protein GGS23DRAFT_613241 [Durotheca rogersii]KAI5861058.1 hypothetical protein GGS23DRAFT_613241 [Durotheca rogersii]